MKAIFQVFFKGLYFFMTDRNFRKFAWLVVRYGSAKRYVTRTIGLSGSDIQVADARSYIWQYYEIFFKEYYRFDCKTPSPVILDCGANIGLSSLHFKRQYPLAQIHAFEPDSHIFGILSRNVSKWGLQQVTLHNEAVWTRNEELLFASEGADGGKISETSGSRKVKAIDLAEFMRGFEHIDFLKIDIEGAEIQLLPHIAGELRKVDHIFVEFHSFDGQPQHLDEVISALCSQGHRLHIANMSSKNAPYIHTRGKYGMDLQLNIFAYRA